MDKLKQAKLQKFVEDKAMADVIYKELNDLLIRKDKKTTDVQFLAAKMIAMNLIDECWSDLLRNNSLVDNEKLPLKQIGL